MVGRHRDGSEVPLHASLTYADDPRLFASMVFHAKSWFEIMPKTMPMMIVGGERVEGSTIMRTGWAVSAVVTIVVVALAWWARS